MVVGANHRKDVFSMKKSDFRIALRGMAEKLDLQWAYAQRIAAEQQAAGTLAYDDNGEPVPNMYQVAYAGMTSAFEDMGGEWQRDETGRHWVYLLGESAAAGRR